MGFQDMSPERLREVRAMGLEAKLAKYPPKGRQRKGPVSVAMRMLDNFRRRYRRGKAEGWEP